MTDNKYDLDALKRQRERIIESIESIENALIEERRKLSQYDMLILEGELLLKKHGICISLRDTGDHNWEVLALFEGINKHAGHWRHRRCRDCNTEERLGYNE